MCLVLKDKHTYYNKKYLVFFLTFLSQILDTMGKAFEQFCDTTSLHGFKFLYVGESKIVANLFWSFVIIMTMGTSALFMRSNIEEFTDTTVAYNLESPTVPLDDVFFPSVAFCNMNSLRKSLIHTLMKDPVVSQKTTFVELRNLIDAVYITGGKKSITEKETDLINSKNVSIAT